MTDQAPDAALGPAATAAAAAPPSPGSPNLVSASASDSVPEPAIISDTDATPLSPSSSTAPATATATTTTTATATATATATTTTAAMATTTTTAPPATSSSPTASASATPATLTEAPTADTATTGEQVSTAAAEPAAALRCPPGFDPEAWEKLDASAQRILAANLPNILSLQTPAEGSPPKAGTKGKGDEEAASAAGAGAGAGASPSAEGQRELSTFVSMSSLLRQDAGVNGGDTKMTPEDLAAARKCKTFFHEVVGSLAPLYDRINTLHGLVESVEEKAVKCKQQLNDTAAELHRRIDLRREEMEGEIERGCTNLTSMVKCTEEKLQSIASVYGTAEEVCGAAIHTGDYSLFKEQQEALDQRFRSSKTHFDTLCVEVERERKLVALEIDYSPASDNTALSQHHLPQMGQVVTRGLGCIMGALDYDTLFHIMSMSAPTDITVFSETFQWLRNLLVIDRFLDTEVALSKNFRREDETGVSLKFSEAVARGLCHRLVGSEQAETMRAQMFDHPFNGAWKCLVTQVANPISEFGDTRSRSITCTNNAEQRFVIGSGTDHAFAISNKPIGDRVVWKFQVLTQLWVGCGILLVADSEADLKIKDRSYNERTCYMFASSNQVYKDGTRANDMFWGTFEENDEALYCLDYASATLYMYHVNLAKFYSIAIDVPNQAENISKFHLHVNLYKDGKVCVAAPNMGERTLMLDEVRRHVGQPPEADGSNGGGGTGGGGGGNGNDRGDANNADAIAP